jgi:hypothetical protein
VPKPFGHPHPSTTDGGYVVDVRPVADYAAGHIPGSVSIPLRPQYATWLGWLLPPCPAW